MIYVYPKKPRNFIMRYVMWLPVLCEVYLFHRDNGIKYAFHWANESLRVRN